MMISSLLVRELGVRALAILGRTLDKAADDQRSRPGRLSHGSRYADDLEAEWPMYDQMARISIEPVWARFFDFGAGRMPSFLTKLAGDA